MNPIPGVTLERVFTEWERRSRDWPDGPSIPDPEGYGRRCAAYFESLTEELAACDVPAGKGESGHE